MSTIRLSKGLNWSEVSEVNLTIHDSKAWKFDISVYLPQLMKFLDYVEHFYCCLSNRLVSFVLFLRFNKFFNTLRQVRHYIESAAFVKWVHVVFRNVDFYLLLFNSFRKVSEKKRLYEVGTVWGWIKLHRHLIWEDLACLLGLRLVLAHQSLAIWIKLFDEQELSIVEVYGKSMLVQVRVMIHFVGILFNK